MAYIPTIDVLRGLRREGFEAYMVAQSRSRIEGKTEYTKHLVRMRHVGQVQSRPEANEIILINSHDGASAYQLLAGVFKFVCHNGLVVGDVVDDIRLPHKGRVFDQVIDSAFKVLDGFETVEADTEAMKALTLDDDEQRIFARAALSLRYGEQTAAPAPIVADQLLQARRPEDAGNTLWQALNRTQEHLIVGGLQGRSATNRRVRTREVRSIDRNVNLNRALWTLAEEMRRLKS